MVIKTSRSNIIEIKKILKISGHQQRWPRPLPGAILIAPALLVVADLRLGVNFVGAASSRDLAFIAISSPGCLLSNNREQHPAAAKVPGKEAVFFSRSGGCAFMNTLRYSLYSGIKPRLPMMDPERFYRPGEETAKPWKISNSNTRLPCIVRWVDEIIDFFVSQD